MSVEKRVMRTPRTVDLEITSKCNLRCLYCSHFTSAGDVADLPGDEWIRFIEELGRGAVMNVSIGGGEPFMRADLKDIIDSVVRNRMRFSLLSNGTLITDDMAAFIASTGRCNYVQVSIDGSSEASHDACRGKGNFRRAVDGMRRLISHKVPLTVRVTIHRDNVNDLDNIVHFLLDEVGVPAISTNAASNVGMCQTNNDIQLTIPDRVAAMESLVRLDRKYPGRINAMAGPLAEARIWSTMEKARLDGVDRLPDRGCLTGCGCPFERFTVRSDGIMVPCGHLSHIELGRINRDSLADVWQNHPALKAIRERRNIPLDSFEFCQGCAYVNYCTGSCPALAYERLGKIDHPCPDSCLRDFLKQGGKLPALPVASQEAGK